jgi:ABC-type branched-subunit amino acid transport system substrate-binding protein
LLTALPLTNRRLPLSFENPSGDALHETSLRAQSRRCRPGCVRPRQPALPFAADTIKVGVLHSLSGTMAISETVLKDTVMMTVDEINAKGGVLGKKLEVVVVDPASNWPLFAEKAKQL